MYDYIKGKLIRTGDNEITIECHGIGYRISVGPSTIGKLPNPGCDVELFLTAVVREDSHKLFGFHSQEQRTFFEKLSNISGIGPKTALNLVGHFELGDLHFMIVNGDTRALCKVPGIGKKTAERMVLELRDYMIKTPPPSSTRSSSKTALDALSALINLGYTPIASQKAVDTALQKQADLALPELITTALQNIQ